jgi:hypothetical protein
MTSYFDGAVVVQYARCFACQTILVVSTTLSDANTEHVVWVVDLFLSAPDWNWRRTGRAECRRICEFCDQKRKRVVSSLSRGKQYPPAHASRQPVLRTGSELIEYHKLLHPAS